MVDEPLTLTGYMDPAFKYFADQTGIGVSEISPMFGGEIYGAGIELVCDMVMKGLLSKGVQTCIGIGCTAYSLFGDGLSIRLKRELLELGTHEISRLIDPKPSDLIEIAECIESISSGISSGDIDLIVAGLFRSPEELKEMYERLTPLKSKTEEEISDVDEDEDEEETFEAIEDEDIDEDDLDEDEDEDVEIEADGGDETYEVIED